MAPSSAPKPAPRRKSKPKFEVPAEVTASAPAAWVYRHDATASRPPVPVTAPPIVRAPSPQAPPIGMSGKPPVQPFADPTMVMLAAIETMAITVAAANRMFLAAASLMGAPIEVTRKILGL